MKRPRLIAALVLVGVFLLGALTGAGVTRALTIRAVHKMMHGSEAPEARVMVWVLDRKLGLSKEQRAAVETVVRRHHPEIVAARRKIAPEVLAIRKTQRDEIRALLTPEQQPRFDALADELDARQRRMFGLP